MNAYTSREQTTYYVKAMEKDVPMAIDILADMLQNSTMDEALIDQERGVILQEKEEVYACIHIFLYIYIHTRKIYYEIRIQHCCSLAWLVELNYIL